MKNKIDRHTELCSYLNLLYKHKNHDYGDSFSETYHKLGLVSAVTRIADKTNRLISLCDPEKTQMVYDESIRDTLLDTANYCIMTVMELDEASENEDITRK